MGTLMPFQFVGELDGGLALAGTKGNAVTATFVGIFNSEERKKAIARQRTIELYDLLRPSLHAYLFSLGMSSDEAEDVIQETFLRLVRYLLDRVTEENPRAWIFRVAHNLSMDLHRSERRWYRDSGAETYRMIRERVDPSPNPEQQVILQERMRRFENSVAQLTPKQRHCLRLRAEGLRYREIASNLQVSVQRVGELMQRAITLLRG